MGNCYQINVQGDFMPTLNDIKPDILILTLTNEQQANLLNDISESFSLSTVSMQAEKFVFLKGKFVLIVKIMGL